MPTIAYDSSKPDLYKCNMLSELDIDNCAADSNAMTIVKKSNTNLFPKPLNSIKYIEIFY